MLRVQHLLDSLSLTEVGIGHVRVSSAEPDRSLTYLGTDLPSTSRRLLAALLSISTPVYVDALSTFLPRSSLARSIARTLSLRP